MKLFLIERRNWMEGDTAVGFVIRATSPKAARKMASLNCGDEGPAVWLNPKKTRCRGIPQSGRAGVIIGDYHNG